MGRQRFDQEIIDFAKELYLTVDDEGNRKYSLKKIAEEVKIKFNVKLSVPTVLNWSRRFGWTNLLDKAIVASACDHGKDQVQEVVTQVIETLPADEELIEKLAKARRWVVVNHLEMAKKLYAEQNNVKSLKGIETAKTTYWPGMRMLAEQCKIPERD